MDLKIISGSLPILLSAPHVFPHLRPGFDAKNPKFNELNTDLIVKTLCQKTSCFGIYTTQFQNIDPNWFKKSPYKKAIKKLVEENGIKFVLDIHGAKKQRLFLIEYDDFRRGEIIKGIEESLKRCLKRFGFSEKEISRRLLRKNDQWTITEFCIEQLKTPALQLEINRRIRNPKNLRFNALLASLECFLKSF